MQIDDKSQIAEVPNEMTRLLFVANNNRIAMFRVPSTIQHMANLAPKSTLFKDT